jgi:hypothetical protein
MHQLRHLLTVEASLQMQLIAIIRLMVNSPQDSTSIKDKVVQRLKCLLGVAGVAAVPSTTQLVAGAVPHMEIVT